MPSPRIPHALAEIFTDTHLLVFKTATAGPGADSGACSLIVTCAASQPRSQRPGLLQAAAETTPRTGKEDLKAVRPACHHKEVGLQEWPLAG